MPGFINNWKLIFPLLYGTIILINQGVHSDLFTALVEMEDLMDTETVLITNLDLYIQVQDEKLAYLRNKLREYQQVHSESSADILLYLSNPVNAFRLTKRLTTDWKEVETQMLDDVGSTFIENVTNYRNILRFPTDEDLNGAAVALTRLQDTYNLDTVKIARGELLGVKYSNEMTMDECFEMGRQLYLNEDFYHSAMWLREAINRVGQSDRNNNTPTTTPPVIQEYLAFTLYKQGYVKEALAITNELLEISPNRSQLKSNKFYYEKELAERKSTKMMRGDDGTSNVDLEKVKVDSAKAAQLPDTDQQVYEKLCRGDLRPSPMQFARLRCRYVTNKNPFLLIAPFKVEEVHLDPYIVVYHEVLSDDELILIKDLAKPRFRRATVFGDGENKLTVADYRISKSAWIKDNEHQRIQSISQRVEDMTGLSMETAEELQVVNYGIGGHYAPHCDFANKEDANKEFSVFSGNRMATVLFYMNDVIQGGATVFPRIRASVSPRKGSATVWYNLYRSGDGDYRTLHAACPVLVGTKWICTKWVHERGQEFRQPCELKPDHPEGEEM